jgi:uncharacterized protein
LSEFVSRLIPPAQSLPTGHLPELVADEWKTFLVDGDFLLFHIPSSSLLSVPEDLWRAVNSGAKLPPAFESELEAVKASLPAPRARVFSPKITAIALNVAETCNLRCVYCYAGDGNYGADTMMSHATGRELIDFFAAQTDRLHVVFFGGEPVLNFELIKDLVAWSRNKTGTVFSWSMTTNGTLLSAQHMAFLKENRFSLTISWDGHGVHAKQRLNKDRVSNSEEAVARKLKALEKDLLELESFQLRGTVLEKNAALLEEAITSTLNDLPHAFMVTLATQSSKYDIAKPAIDKAMVVTEQVVERWMAAGDYDRLRRLKSLWGQVSRIHRADRGTMTCGAGVNYLSVSTTGGFYLCHRFTEDPREKVGDLKSGLDRAKLATYAQHRTTQHDPCRSCWMREVCAGGCFHDNRMTHGTAFRPDPKFCHTQDLLMHLAIKVYARLRAKAPHVLDNKPVHWRTENA